MCVEIISQSTLTAPVLNRLNVQDFRLREVGFVGEHFDANKTHLVVACTDI